MYWVVLVCIGWCWYVLGDAGMYWVVLVCIGWCWYVLGDAGVYWVMLPPDTLRLCSVTNVLPIPCAPAYVSTPSLSFLRATAQPLVPPPRSLVPPAHPKRKPPSALNAAIRTSSHVSMAGQPAGHRQGLVTGRRGNWQQQQGRVDGWVPARTQGYG